MASQVQRELDADAAGAAPRGARSAAGDERDGRGDAARRFRPDPRAERAAALVSNSGATYDVVEPNAPDAATTTLAGVRLEKPLPRAVEGTRQAGTSSQSEALTRLANSVAAPAAREPRGSERMCHVGRGPALRAGATATSSTPAPRTVAAPTTSAQATAADRGQPGWLSNLLAAASRDEPEEAHPRARKRSRR